ncbi:hypothetical protein GL218_08385 [Daldinia childiae]|uniref:uncharacterized protein n=1 Tax=Daldinia childiae TaxID=326645 RepID=UPI0014470720|nr:uncharacterized protein GL218_08385 [Daldinia childiae]KAF3068494.1 hypothetical protein GL218_08385 [Daldinia childiae]
MAKDNDNSAANPPQSKRPPVNRHDSDSQVSDHASHQHHRSKPQKHVVGATGRFHPRVPSSKTLHKSTSKLIRRPSSPSPERAPVAAQSHRNSNSDVKLQQDPSSSNLNKNPSQSSLKRNRSHVEIGKRPKSTTSIKRSSSHKDVNKLKGAKNQVHFDLGSEQEDEWVDASTSASPYLSRRGSAVSSEGKAPHSRDNSRPQTPHEDISIQKRESSPRRETAQHNQYLTSRLLQRTPSSGAPPQMSTETVSVRHQSGSPESQLSHGQTSLYGTPKNTAVVGSGQEELISRFVNGSGPGSGPNVENGGFYPPTRNPSHRPEGVRRPQSLGNLNQNYRISISDDETDSALAPRTRKTVYKPAPAEKSRTQQKLNLQRASSSIEPSQPVGGVGVVGVGVGPLASGYSYDNRDPRMGKLLERTGMEYLVVRRYQNPIARSIARLSHLPSAKKNQHIPNQNGSNGTANGKRTSGLGGASRLGLSQSLTDRAKSRPTTPSQGTSIRLNGANSGFEGDEERIHERISESSYADGEDDGVAGILRNLWDKSMDLSASQD